MTVVEIRAPRIKITALMLFKLGLAAWLMSVTYLHPHDRHTGRLMIVVVALLCGVVTLGKYLWDPRYFHADDIGLTRYLFWGFRTYSWDDIGRIGKINGGFFRLDTVAFYSKTDPSKILFNVTPQMVGESIDQFIAQISVFYQSKNIIPVQLSEGVTSVIAKIKPMNTEATRQSIEIQKPRLKSLKAMFLVYSIAVGFLWLSRQNEHQFLLKNLLAGFFMIIGLPSLKFFVYPKCFSADNFGVKNYSFWGQKNYSWSEIDHIDVLTTTNKNIVVETVRFFATDGRSKPLFIVVPRFIGISKEDFLAELSQLEQAKRLFKASSGAA